MATHKYKRGFRVEKPCAECGKQLSLVPSVAAKTSCCSLSCSSKQKARRQGKAVKAMRSFCVNCHIEFRPNPRSDSIGKYCGRSCAYDHKSETARIVACIKSLGSENRARREAWEFANRPPRYVLQGPVRPVSGKGSIGKCTHCLTEYARSNDRQRHCSQACEDAVASAIAVRSKEYRKQYRKTTKSRAQKKLYKTLRRRRELKVFEAVDPVAVFDRDKWVCQICRIKTPKAKRGTNEPNAPELDHIIPLAKGGPHTWANLQCSCRRCNGMKGDKPMGQLLLVGIA